MLCVERGKSSKVDVCEALLYRAVLEQEEKALIEDLMWRASRGMDGELRSDRFWSDLQLDMPHLLFHNYEVMQAGRFTHQMDTVFLCERFVLIIDLKHIAGEITYDEATHQLLRVANGQVLALGDPFSQVMRHEAWFQQFLWEVGVELPIITAVVVTTTSSIVGKMPERFHMFKLPGLRIKLRDWFDSHPVQMNAEMLQLLKVAMLRRHHPQKWRHPLGAVRIRKGALCTCGKRMTYCYGKFVCVCGEVSRTAMLRGLHDYRLLVSEWITNAAFRSFFGIESADVVNKILSRSGFTSDGGATKGKRYLIPPDVWRK